MLGDLCQACCDLEDFGADAMRARLGAMSQRTRHAKPSSTLSLVAEAPRADSPTPA